MRRKQVRAAGHQLIRIAAMTVQAVGPTLWLFVISRWAIKAFTPVGRGNFSRRLASVLTRLMRQAWRQWVSVELLWYLMFVYERKRLSAPVAIPPVRGRVARQALLRRCIDSFDEVMLGDLLLKPGTVTGPPSIASPGSASLGDMESFLRKVTSSLTSSNDAPSPARTPRLTSSLSHGASLAFRRKEFRLF